MPYDTTAYIGFQLLFKNKDTSAIDVYIDGDIVDASTQEIMKDWFGDETSTSYKSFRNQIDAANPKEVNVWINSPGGHVGDAMAMHDYLADLENKGVKVNRRGRGIIASAGTYILMGNNSEMSENSFMMIHNVQMGAYGDIQYVENQVKTGRKFNDRVRDFYSNHTGIAPETISGWMNKETWFTAQEAFDKGFIKNKPTTSAAFTNVITDDRFPFLNKAILNSYNSNIKNFDMPINLKEAIKNEFAAVLESLGLSNKKDDANVVAAINNFTTKITEAIGEPLTTEAVNALITTAIANLATKAEIPTIPVVQDISNLATKAELANFATKEDIKPFVTKADIANAQADLAGGETKPAATTKKNLGGLARNKNRFAGVSYEDVTVK